MKKITAVLITLTLALVMVFAVGCGDKPQQNNNNNEYTVTFDYNYEGAPAAVTQKVKHGQSVTAPANPYRSGYTFAGWYNGAARFDLTSAVRSDLTLMARWNNAPAVKENNLVFEVTDGVKYLFGHGEAPTEVKIGDTVSFSIEQSPFYKGTAEVYANGTLIDATTEAGDVRKIYTVTVEEPTTITVSGIEADSDFFKGLGTATNPYKISSPAQWLLFANIQNRQIGNISSSYFELTDDLDFLGYSIPSIDYFGGTLRGNGHKMENFEIVVHANIPNPEDPNTIEDSANAGLFGRLAAATVTDLELNGKVTVAGNTIMCVGVFAGDIVSSTVKNVHVSGEVRYYNTNYYYTSVGGFASTIRAVAAFGPTSVTYCTSSVTVNADYIAYAGGFAARVSGNVQAPTYIANCASYGNVTGGHYAGGFTAYAGAYSSIANSYCTGSVVAETSYETGDCAAGGFVGYMSKSETVIQNCFTSSRYAAYAPVAANAHKGDIFGEYDFDFSNAGADLNASLVYNTYYAPGGVAEGKDLKTADGVKELLGWNVDSEKWIFGNGYPQINKDPAKQVTAPLTVTVDLDGKTVTQTDNDASPDSQGNYPDKSAVNTVSYNLSDYTAIMSISEPHKVTLANGMLLRDTGTTFFSCGYCYEEDGEQIPLPAAFLITDNDADKIPAVKLRFTDYAEAVGTYDFVANGTKYALTLATPTASALTSGLIENEVSYVYFGDGYLVIDGLPAFIGTEEVVATLNGNELEFAGITATLRTTDEIDFTGVYVTDIYTGITVVFTDEVVSDEDGVIIYALEYYAYGSGYNGIYLVEEDVVTAAIGNEIYLFLFDDDGYLYQLSTDANGNAKSVEQVFAWAGEYAGDESEIRDGTFVGEWYDEVSGFGIKLDGITYFGYGYATDNDGIEYTYKVNSSGVMTFYLNDSYAFAAAFNGINLTIERSGKIFTAKLYNKFGGYWYSDEDTLVIDSDYVKVNGDLGVDYEYYDPYAIFYGYNGLTYGAVVTGDNEITLINWDTDEIIAKYKRYDEFYGKFINEDRSVSFEFNGESDLNRGKVVITENGIAREYEYNITAHGVGAVAEIVGSDEFGEVKVIYTVKFENGLIDVAPESGRKYKLGIDNDFTGTWSVSQYAFIRVKVGVLNKSMGGEGFLQWFVDSMPIVPNADFEYDSSTGEFKVIDKATGGHMFSMVYSDGEMQLVLGNVVLPMAITDEAWGVWTSASGGRFEVDGTAFNSAGYRGLVSYYENYSVDLQGNETYTYADVLLYDRELLNDKYVYCLYNLSGNYLSVYATFDIYTNKTSAEIQEIRAELDASRIAYEVYANGSNYMIIKPLGAVLGSVNVLDGEGNRIGRFGDNFVSAAADGGYEGGTVELHMDIREVTYRYSVEYVSENGTIILSLYEQGARGVRGKLVYFAVVNMVDDNYVMELIENTDTESLPLKVVDGKLEMADTEQENLLNAAA